MNLIVSSIVQELVQTEHFQATQTGRDNIVSICQEQQIEI